MRPKRRLIAAGMVLLLFTGSAAAVLATEDMRWRAEVLGLKLRGGVTELSWGELLKMLRPGSGYYLRPVLDTGNAYAAVRNPFTSGADVAAGAELFRAECGTCHGADGSGAAGPSLRDRTYQHGDSDLALYRVITRGIPGTAMPGRDFRDLQTWQLVAFLRSISASVRAGGDEGASDPPLDTYSVTDERLRATPEQPGDWLMYSGAYDGRRFSRLDQIDRAGVAGLRLKWVYQFGALGAPVEATPVVVGGVMYVVQPPNDVLALDAASGKLRWRYRRTLPKELPVCCQATNRGVAVFGDRVFVGTLDAHLVALDAATGRLVWDVEVENPANGYSITSAPLAVNGKILIGVAGGEFAIRGFLDAYDAQAGGRSWRFYTIPAPGEPGIETWAGDSWRRGGGPTWLTGSFDPELNLVYWGVGNPYPPFLGDDRAGDNLYTNSVVALDADSGKLRWYFQFTPHDLRDWDANQIPVLADRVVDGEVHKTLLFANRNGFFYVLDRATGQFLLGRPFVKQTWAKGLTETGRPIVAPESLPSVKGSLAWPAVGGGTNWWSPSYSPVTDLFYVGAVEQAGILFKGTRTDQPHGEMFTGGSSQRASEAKTFIRALRPATGEVAWDYEVRAGTRNTLSGVLSTAGKIVFAGRDGHFFALDGETGHQLWRTDLGGGIHAGPITFLNQGRQLVTIPAGSGLFTFELLH